jgi:hypothetical protein
LMFQVLKRQQLPKTFLTRSKSQDQEVDFAEPFLTLGWQFRCAALPPVKATLS